MVPQLRQIDFETMTVQRDNKNLITDFNARFSETINKLNRKDSWVDEVLDIQKKIRDELSTKMVRPKKIPTEYTYILNYQSVIKDEVWEYREKTTKKPEVLGPVDSNEQISNDLKSKFRNRDIIRAKKSKYNIKRCDVTINNEKPVQDLKQTD